MMNCTLLAKALAATAVAALCTQIAFAAPAAKPLADRHVAAGQKCDACHETATGGKLKAGGDYGVCATCHGDYNAMIKKTEAKTAGTNQPNPHAQHEGALPCTECHKAHSKGVNYCGQCHSFVYTIP